MLAAGLELGSGCGDPAHLRSTYRVSSGKARVILHRFTQVESTQLEARKLAEAGSGHGTVVWADEQTAGRGRLGRSWTGTPGESLLFSVVLRPGGLARDAALLSLGAAAGVAEALDVRVKWPNDLVDGQGRKLGGFLGELELDGTGIRYVLLGLGLNVSQAAFGPELPNATSLRLVHGEHDREDVLDRAVRAILAWSSHPDRLELWRSRAHTLGKWVKIGEREGIATALRDDGALIVGGVAVTTGEVEVVLALG